MTLRRGIAVSFFDQSLLSLANFFMGIYLIRHVSKVDYGQYVLAVTGILYVLSVQNALINTPLTVLAPYRTPGSRDRFCAALAAGQYIILVPLIIAGMIAVSFFSSVAGDGDYLNPLVIATGGATVGILLREFCRSCFFQIAKPFAVLSLDVFYLLLLGCGLTFALRYAPARLSVAAILLTGLASLLAALPALAKLRIFIRIGYKEIRSALAESWKQGRWALLGVTVTWLQDQSYIYLLGILGSAPGMAEAGATRLFIAPLALMNVSLMRILMPRWVTLRAEGEISRISSSGRKALWLMLGIVVAYLAVLYPFRHFLAGKFLTSEYTDITILLLLWGIHFLLQFQRSNISAQLQVFLQFRRITTANLASSVVVIIVGCILISAYGVRGSIVSLIIGELVLTLLLWRSLRNVS